MATWFEDWHGAKLPAAAVSGMSTSGGGSTAMSTGVVNAFSTKASLGHTHPQSEVAGLASSLSDLAAAISTKAAGSHTHPQSDVVGLESTIGNISALVASLPTLPISMDGVTGLTSTLAGLAASISTKAAGSHTHAQADITDLASTLSALSVSISTKAAGVHSHAQADITDLTSTLSALSASISTKAAGVHSHATVDASAPGYCPQLPANSTTWLRSDGAWVAPPSGDPGGGGIPSTWVTLSTHVLTGSTTMQSVTGLSFAVSSAAIYRFEFTCIYQSISSATGLALGINGPAHTGLAYEISVSSGLGPTVTRTGRAFNVQQLPSAQSSVANVDMYGYLGGVARVGANAGTLQLQFASEVAGSTVSVRAGSVGVLCGPL